MLKHGCGKYYLLLKCLEDLRKGEHLTVYIDILKKDIVTDCLILACSVDSQEQGCYAYHISDLA